MIVFHRAEATEAHFIDVSFQRAERSDENVNTKVKFFATDEKRIVYVSGNNVRVSCRLLGNVRSCIRPFFQLRKLKISFLPKYRTDYLVNKKNAYSSSFSAGLHYPS